MTNVTPLLEPLSAAQLRVLALLNRGLTTREIAQELRIAVGTVRWHLNHVFEKLRVRNRTQAVVRARELRLF
jgi:LuxR family maltose regulon positive regulatory protein